MKSRAIHLLATIVILLLLVVALGSYTLTREYTNKPIVAEKMAQRDASYLYSFYFSGNPHLEGRTPLGNPTAPVTMTAYITPASPDLAVFFEEVMPEIEEEHLSRNALAIYVKYLITVDDLTEKTDTFIKAQAIECIRKDHPAWYQSSWITLLQEPPIDDDRIAACIDGPIHRELIEDVSEVEQFGMTGLSTRFYIGLLNRDNSIIEGVPAYQQFRVPIRNHEVSIGI